MTTTPNPTAEQIARKALVKTQREGLPRPRQAAQVIADIRAAGLLGGNPTEEQIEGAARALCAEEQNTPWERFHRIVQDRYRATARIALAGARVAVQEPSGCAECHRAEGHKLGCSHRLALQEPSEYVVNDDLAASELSRDPNGWDEKPAPSPDREKLIAEARDGYQHALIQGWAHTDEPKPLAIRLADALAAPPTVDEEKLAGVVMELIVQWNSCGHPVAGDTRHQFIARGVAAWLRGGGR
jgi:hypothetical protein